MNPNPDHLETFESFKKSFFYGNRSDMSFKFLAHLTDEQAAEFFQGLLSKLIEAYDSGDPAPIYEHIRQGQVLSYAQEARAVFDDGPFTPLTEPLSATRLMLLTSSGHFVRGDDPKPLGQENMTQAQAENQIKSFLKEAPTLSAIPTDTPAGKIEVRHGGYDVRGAKLDPGVVLPLQQLIKLAVEGVVAKIVDPVFSFVGACSQVRLQKTTGPEWISCFQGMGVDAALLVPV